MAKTGDPPLPLISNDFNGLQWVAMGSWGRLLKMQKILEKIRPTRLKKPSERCIVAWLPAKPSPRGNKPN